MSLTQEQVVEALRPVQDPELRRSIVDLGMVKAVRIDKNVKTSIHWPGSESAY